MWLLPELFRLGGGVELLLLFLFSLLLLWSDTSLPELFRLKSAGAASAVSFWSLVASLCASSFGGGFLTHSSSVLDLFILPNTRLITSIIKIIRKNKERCSRCIVTYNRN